MKYVSLAARKIPWPSSCRVHLRWPWHSVRRFLQQTADWSDKLALLRGTNLAALD